MKLKVSPGKGKALKEPLPKLPWLKKKSVRIQRIGKKRKQAKFVRRRLWSPVFTCRKRSKSGWYFPTGNHIGWKVIERLDNIEQNLCSHKGNYGEPARQLMISKGYNPNVKSSREEVHEEKGNPWYKSRRWGSEVSHSSAVIHLEIKWTLVSILKRIGWRSVRSRMKCSTPDWSRYMSWKLHGIGAPDASPLNTRKLESNM